MWKNVGNSAFFLGGHGLIREIQKGHLWLYSLKGYCAQNIGYMGKEGFIS